MHNVLCTHIVKHLGLSHRRHSSVNTLSKLPSSSFGIASGITDQGDRPEHLLGGLVDRLAGTSWRCAHSGQGPPERLLQRAKSTVSCTMALSTTMRTTCDRRVHPLARAIVVLQQARAPWRSTARAGTPRRTVGDVRRTDPGCAPRRGRGAGRLQRCHGEGQRSDTRQTHDALVNLMLPM